MSENIDKLITANKRITKYEILELLITAAYQALEDNQRHTATTLNNLIKQIEEEIQ